MDKSYAADGDTFIKGNVAITSTGVAMKNKEKTFTVVYEELEKGIVIGRGCSSVVLKSKHIPSNTPLALKVINMHNKGKREQMMREITALFDAQCPCLVKFYGAFYREASITIALEYMDGGSLDNVVSQVGNVPEKALANITYQILFGLAYLKNEKKVHRDIKPSNMLINSIGEVKVTDFGIAAELHNSLAMCATFVGTFKYMSPERIQRLPYGYSSDIWSLGLVLLECASGRYPYPEQSTAIEMIQTLLESPPPEPSPEYFSPEFCSFIQGCLHKVVGCFPT